MASGHSQAPPPHAGVSSDTGASPIASGATQRLLHPKHSPGAAVTQHDAWPVASQVTTHDAGHATIPGTSGGPPSDGAAAGEQAANARATTMTVRMGAA